MWSHYGEEHKGICLGFDIPDELARPVEYLPEVLIIGRLIVENRNDFPQEQGQVIVDRLLGGKYRGWSYEQELRVHADRLEKDEETGQFFVDFSDKLVLREVIAGARFRFGRQPIEEALAGYPAKRNVMIRKVRPALTRFEIEAEENGFQTNGA